MNESFDTQMTREGRPMGHKATKRKVRGIGGIGRNVLRKITHNYSLFLSTLVR